MVKSAQELTLYELKFPPDKVVHVGFVAVGFVVT